MGTAQKKYSSYQRIKEDFEKLNEEGDSFSEFNNKFNEYLAEITDNALETEESDGGLRITSGKNQIGKELLSAGTKKTLLLAFRLAVLGYYFPNGGGMIVLDDDLLDMDPDRRKRAAKLLKKFAENNQVIFITCDPSIAELLSGKKILMSR